MGQDQIKPVTAKLEAVANFPTPVNKKELNELLGNDRVLPKIL